MTALITLSSRFRSTVAMELAVALSGLAMVLFIFGHLAGNLLIFAGPEALNTYADKLQSLGPLLWVARIGLIAALVTHMGLTVYVTLANRAARGQQRYAMNAYVGPKTVASRLMVYTGIIIFSFLVLHLLDFTFAAKTGPATVVAGMGAHSLGLFGLVWNTFANPVHALVYIVAVWAVGLHFMHCLSSVWVTLGALTDRATPKADAISLALGVAVSLGFSAIPVYVLVRTHLTGV